MPTFNDLADAALSEVYGHTQTQEVGTYLAVAMSATDLTFTVSNAAGFSRGLVQIGDELVIVDAVDRDKNLLTIGYITGRGVRSTQTTAHVVGDRVTMSPLIPRQKSKDAVSEAIKASNLYAVKIMEFQYQATIHGYSLPPGFRDVLNVQWLPPGPDVVWHPIRRWTADRFSRSIILGESPVQGHSVKVTFSADPAVPSSFADDFSGTGLPDSCYDVIRWSAAWRMVSFMEPFNLAGIRAEGDAMKKPESSGSRLRVSQYFYQMFAQREQEELMDLARKFPIRAHWGGTNGMALTYYATTRPGALSTAMNSSTTSVPLVSAATFPDPAGPGNGQYTIIIGYGSDREEVCTVTAKVGDTLTVIRGQDSTAATGKNQGDVVVHGVSARDFKSFILNTDPRLTDARTPTVHAPSHAIGGTDPLTTAAIGAAALVHAPRHAVGGADPVTPAAIGAADAAATTAAFAALKKVWAGVVLTDTNGNFTINYAAAGFPAPPVVVAQPVEASNHLVATVWPSSITATGAAGRCAYWTGSTFAQVGPSTPIHVHAIQQ